MKKLSIVVPCYNESKNIPLILERFEEIALKIPLEVVLVNNGSTDNSKSVFEALVPGYPFVKIAYVPVNQGYGYGILQGIKYATGDFVGWTHADMQTDPLDIYRAYNLLKKHGFDSQVFIKGTRKKRPLSDVFFTVGMGIFESIYLRKKLWDINAQPNIFHKSFLSHWKNPPHDFALDLYALYMARTQKLHIMRIPVLFPKRIYGTSSWNTGIKSKFKLIKRTISFSSSLKRALKNDIHSTQN